MNVNGLAATGRPLFKPEFIETCQYVEDNVIWQELTALVEFVLAAVWKVWPLFLLTIVLSVLVRGLKLDRLIRAVFNRNLALSVVLAAAVGAFSPFCSCSVVPVISGLLVSGVPLAPVMAFWIASPTMDPEIFTLSVATLGWPLALARLGATLILSLGGGFLTLALIHIGILSSDLLKRKASAEDVSVQPTVTPAANPLPVMPLAAITMNEVGPDGTLRARSAAPASGWMLDLREVDWQQVGRKVASESWGLGRWLLLAFTLEALIVRYVPQAAIAGLLGEQSRLAVPLAALIGIPLYLNNAGALPIVSGLLAQGMQPGAAIAFLIAGPITTVPAMAAVWGIVRRRVFALYVGVGLFGAMAMGWLVNLVL